MAWRGKLVIILMLAAGIAAAAVAWRHNYLRGRRALNLWGSEAAMLVRYAATVEWASLSPADVATANEGRTIDGLAYELSEWGDISSAKGLSHARQALMEDASFEAAAPSEACIPSWSLAVSFRDRDRRTTLVFDFACRRVRHLESGREGVLTPRTNKAMETFFAEVVSERQAGGGAPRAQEEKRRRQVAGLGVSRRAEAAASGEPPRE